MKKFFSILLLPVLALITLCGCGSDKKIKDVEETYIEMVAKSHVDDDGNKVFFSDEDNYNAISIKYSTLVENVMNTATPSNAVLKRYKGIHYQQKILDVIFDYYNKYQAEFYRIAESKDIDEDEINDLYDRLINLKNVLRDFQDHYDTFSAATELGVSDVMKFNLTSYSFQLNKVIDASFNFIHKFEDMYIKYCVEDYEIFNSHNLNSFVDIAYLDIAYVVYLENIKAFNDSVGDNGVCDLSDVVGSLNKYNILGLLDNKKSLSLLISENIGADTEVGNEVTNRVKLFVYVRDVFEQRLSSYISTYSDVDMYELNRYRFELNSGVSYNNYLLSLSASDRAVVTFLDDFVSETFVNYINKLNTIVE